MTYNRLIILSVLAVQMCLFYCCGNKLDKLEDIEVEDQAGVERAGERPAAADADVEWYMVRMVPSGQVLL